MSSDLGRKAPAAEGSLGMLSLGLVVVGLGFSLLLGGATAWDSLGQSLWLDELHTAWSSSGTAEEILTRAAIGNQTPIYFAWQWWLGQTFGYSEVGLRATSLVAWFLSLAIVAAVIGRLVARTGHSGLWCILIAMMLDRQQIFFATEARPYMLLSLIVLTGWLALDLWLAKAACSVGNSVGHSVGNWRRPKVAWWIWLVCAGLALWLQPIALLFVASQFALVLLRSWPMRYGYMRSILWPTLLSLMILVGVCWPMRYVLQPAWESRQAWAAFAADLRWQNILRQLPIAVVGLPGLVALGIHWISSRRRRVAGDDPSIGDSTAKLAGPPSGDGGYGLSDGGASRASLTWLVAWAGPLAMVLVLTAGGVAPLMHARYLFAATLPLALWSANAMAQLSSGRAVAMLAAFILIAQTIQQGSVHAWLAGRLPVVERAEDWRGALRHVCQAAIDKSERIDVFCASNLIEGSRSSFLPHRVATVVEGKDSLPSEYLTLPLRSIYRLPDQARIVCLLNDPRSWPAVISEHERGAAGGTGQRWLVVRCSPAGLAKRLQASRIEPREQLDFGQVQLVRF